MDASKSSAPHPGSVVEAAAWRAWLLEHDVASTAQFEQWLAADAGNRAAWEGVSEPWDAVEQQLNSPDMLVLRRQALGHARAASHRRSREASFAEHGRRYAWAAGVVLAVTGALAAWIALKPDVYSSGLGERRTVTLEDGSTLVLDSATEVRVSYSDTARDVEISQGQARFTVAPDVARPFAVTVGRQKAIALGTAFNVDVLGGVLRVTLLEGRVAVLNEDTRRSRELKPGEQWTLTGEDEPTVTEVTLDNITAWESGQLIFIGEPLASVVERVNRYSSRRLEVADRRAAALKVSGVFNTGDVDRFVTTVTDYLPLVAEPGRGGSVRLRHR